MHKRFNTQVQHQYTGIDIISHTGTVVPECYKDDNVSQSKVGKFNPRYPQNPSNDDH